MNGNLIVKNAAELVTLSGRGPRSGTAMGELGIIAGGAVVIRDGEIAAVGPTDQLMAGLAENDQELACFDIVDAGGRAVLPGFVDPHTHLVFGGYRAEEFAWRLGGTDYMEIMRRGGGILSTVRATRATPAEELFDLGLRRLDAMLAMGVTTVEAKSGYGLDRDTEIKQLEVIRQLDSVHYVDVVPTFLGAHAVPEEYAGRPDAFIDFLVAEVLPEVAERRLAEFCDVFCEAHVFSVAQSRRLLEQAAALGLKPKLHADEIVALGGAELAAELGAVSADHLLKAGAEGLERMAAAGVVATLLPATAFSLRAAYPDGRQMIERGLAVALATDFNPGSCFTESLPLVCALAALYAGLSPEEVVCAVTLNAAAALGRAGRVGSLEPGKQGDVVILEFPSYRFIPYHLAVSSVEKVVKAGNLVFDKYNGGVIPC